MPALGLIKDQTLSMKIGKLAHENLSSIKDMVLYSINTNYIQYSKLLIHN